MIIPAIFIRYSENVMDRPLKGIERNAERIIECANRVQEPTTLPFSATIPIISIGRV